jgi:hypothetical protein
MGTRLRDVGLATGGVDESFDGHVGHRRGLDTIDLAPARA